MVARTIDREALPGLDDESTSEPEAAGQGEQDDHDHPADELADGELPTDEHRENDPEFNHEVR
jgi:hypothetical protein